MEKKAKPIEVEELIKGLRRSDEQCFNLLFHRYFKRLHFFAIQYVKDAGAAESLVLDTFVTLWKKRKELKSDRENGLLSWLYIVLKNNCFQHLKAESLTKSNVELFSENQLKLDLAGLQTMEISEDFFDEISAIISNTLETLPPRCRQVFEMSRTEGMKNREIAEALHISEKAVEGNISRALKEFRKNLKDYLPYVLIVFNL